MASNKNHTVIFISMMFWGIILIILLSIAQPLPPITQGVYIACMVIMAIFILLDKKPIRGALAALGNLMMIAFGPWSLLIILSTRLVKGYYRKKPVDRISGSNPDL